MSKASMNIPEVIYKIIGCFIPNMLILVNSSCCDGTRGGSVFGVQSNGINISLSWLAHRAGIPPAVKIYVRGEAEGIVAYW